MRVVSLAFVATAAAAALLLQPVAAANYGFATGVSKAGLDSFKNAVLPELNAALAQFAVRRQRAGTLRHRAGACAGAPRSRPH